MKLFVPNNLNLNKSIHLSLIEAKPNAIYCRFLFYKN